MNTAPRSPAFHTVVLLLLSSAPLINLTAIPAFVDEGSQLQLIYGIRDAGQWLAPLGYGKPLEVWPMIAFVNLPIEPLLAIRAVHVLVGVLGCLLTYRLAARLASPTSAFICAALFALCPFVVFLQRLALSEIFLCAAGVWVLLSVLRLLEEPTWKHATHLAIALVAAAFCKLPVGFVFLVWTALAILLQPAPLPHLLRGPVARKLWAAHLPVICLALLITAVVIVRLRHGLSPGFALQDLMTISLEPRYDIAATIGVARPSLTGELAAQLSWPVLILAAMGLIGSALRGDRPQRWLLACGLLPMLVIGLLPKFWYSHYLLFTLPPLIICSVLGWQAIARPGAQWTRPVAAGALALCIGLAGWQSARLIFNPMAASWSPLDRFQYFEGWTSGYGFPEAAAYILSAAQPPREVYSLDGAGAYQLRNYLPQAWRSRVRPVSYGPDSRPLHTAPEYLHNLELGPAWIVSSEQLLPLHLEGAFGPDAQRLVQLRRLVEFDKPGGHGQLALFEATVR